MYVPIDDTPLQLAQGLLRLGKTYSLQIFPRRYYRRSDGSVVTYLTPAGGAGSTDIGIRIAENAITPCVVAGAGWGKVYWHLAGNEADVPIGPEGGSFRLTMYLIPVKLERLPEGQDVLRYSLDRLFEAVRDYNGATETENVPPHIAYATFMTETSGYAYSFFQNEYWTLVNKGDVSAYPHVHASGLPNCTEEHTDSGFGPAQLTGLTALEMIQSVINTWLGWQWNVEARNNAINGLKELVPPVANTKKMLEKLSSGFPNSDPQQYQRWRLADWAKGGKKSALTYYNRYDNRDRNSVAWQWLTNNGVRDLVSGYLRPFPLSTLRQWDPSYTDEDYDGDLWEGIDQPRNPPIYIARAMAFTGHLVTPRTMALWHPAIVRMLEVSLAGQLAPHVPVGE